MAARDRQEWEHQGDWEGKNPNQEEECRGLRALGVHEEYYKVYELKAVHLVGTWKIVKLNKEILKKVNNLAKQRMEFNRMVVEGASADEREYAGRNITNLKRKILEFQAAVESGGGTAFQIPDEINDVP